jgi:hypothetical protein
VVPNGGLEPIQEVNESKVSSDLSAVKNDVLDYEKEID